MDGAQTQPFDVSYVIINVAQRVSFVLDWDKLPKSMKNSPSVIFRVNAVPAMYPTYDPAAPNEGLFASTSFSPYNVHWTGKFLFNEIATRNQGNPYYDILNPPASPANPPSDTNMLQALPLFPTTVPSADLSIYYLIEFYDDDFGVNRPHVNGAIFPGFSDAELGHPVLYDYMSAAGGPLVENDSLPVGGSISGSGTSPFVLPYGRTIDILFNNTDGGEHPLHIHGHTFWVIKTSDYDSGHAVLRDIVSVPAQGWAIIRFDANNPGVWLLHCHIDWHFKAGFSSTIIEAPELLKDTIHLIPDDHKAACAPFFDPSIIITAPVNNQQACFQTCTSQPI
jgi:FtsP/CotA-like multicopper oxidase with cupredoxin domain